MFQGKYFKISFMGICFRVNISKYLLFKGTIGVILSLLIGTGMSDPQLYFKSLTFNFSNNEKDILFFRFEKVQTSNNFPCFFVLHNSVKPINIELQL